MGWSRKNALFSQGSPGEWSFLTGASHDLRDLHLRYWRAGVEVVPGLVLAKMVGHQVGKVGSSLAHF